MVPVRRGVIVLGDAYQADGAAADRASRSRSATMRAHHIVPSELEAAPPLAQRAAGGDSARYRTAPLLVHHAPLDLGFLKAGCRRAGVAWPRVAVVDTVELLWKQARRQRYLRPSPSATRS